MKQRRYRLFYLICLSILITSGVDAQVGRFNKVYQKDGSQLAYNVVTVGSGYCIDGMIKNDSNEWELLFLKINSFGDSVFSRKLQIEGMSSVSGTSGSLLRKAPNQLIKVGSIRTDLDGQHRPFILDLDSNLDSTRATVFNNLFGVYFNTASFIHSGVLCGGYVYDSTLNLLLPTMTLIDSNHNLIRHDTLDPGQDVNGWVRTISQTSDLGLVIGGAIWNEAGSSPWIVRTDSLFSPEWIEIVNESELSEGGACAALMNNNEIIIASRHPDRVSSFNQIMGRARLTKMTLDGEIIWSKLFGTSQVGDGFSMIQVTPEDEVLAISLSQQKHDSIGYLDAWVLRVSSDGDSLWESRFDVIHNRAFKDCITYPRSLYLTQDKGFVCAGFAIYTDTTNGNFIGRQDMWAVKFDSNGCFDTVFSCPPVIPEDSLTGMYSGPAHDRTFIYPNPTSGTVYLEGRPPLRIEVRDGLGRLMLTILDSGREVDISELNAGVYFGTLFYREGDITTVKWIKE